TAIFTDTNPATAAGDFTAVIDWGDGIRSAGKVVGSNGTFTVTGSHRYDDEGFYAVTVQINHDSATAVAFGRAVVRETLLPAGNPEGPRGTPEERWLSEVFHDLNGGQVPLGFLRKWTKRLHQNGMNRRKVIQGILQEQHIQGREGISRL